MPSLGENLCDRIGSRSSIPESDPGPASLHDEPIRYKYSNSCLIQAYDRSWPFTRIHRNDD